MKTVENRYIKPKIRRRTVKGFSMFFFNKRFLDSANGLAVGKVYAASSCGCGSSSIKET